MKGSTTTDKRIKYKLSKPKSDSSLRQWCPHCRHRWKPKRGKQVEWCPRCHLNITTEKPVRDRRGETIRIIGAERFTPGRMQTLCRLQFYKYLGIPRDLPLLTPGRTKHRNINLRLADKFFRTDMSGKDIADEMGIARQAFYIRIQAAFDLMVIRGSFQLTAKGREKIAREKLELAATKSTRRSESPSSSSASGAV